LRNFSGVWRKRKYYKNKFVSASQRAEKSPGLT